MGTAALQCKLVLANTHLGMAADDLSDCHDARSTGHFALLMTLITRGCTNFKTRSR